jgi:hypothetical protein
LKREDEEDRLWDWQSRTWADLTRFLVSVAIFQLSHRVDDKLSANLKIKELMTSAIHLLKEQHLGSRIVAGSEPGPFLVKRKRMGNNDSAILEIVHPDLAAEHPATKHFGRLGGHLYLVLTPLNNQQISVFTVWAVHTAGAASHPPWSKIGRSAGQALIKHSAILDDLKDPELPKIKGFVIASDTESKSVELHPGYKEEVHLLQVTTEQRCWEDAMAGITAIIEEILEGAF